MEGSAGGELVRRDAAAGDLGVQRFFRKECSTEMVNARMFARVWALFALGGFVIAQAPAPAVTLADALQRARMYGGQVQSANLAVLEAGEDRFQAAEGEPAHGQRVQSVHLHGGQRHSVGRLRRQRRRACL